MTRIEQKYLRKVTVGLFYRFFDSYWHCNILSWSHSADAWKSSKPWHLMNQGKTEPQDTGYLSA